VYLTDVIFHDARTLEEAGSLMTQYAPDARLLAGGTDLLVDLKTGRAKYGHVVSMTGIEALHGITADADGLRIGALATPNELAAHPAVKERFVPILDATSKLAAQQIRNMATVGGNIAGAIPSADLPPILMVMGASVVIWSPKGERTVPVESVFIGPRKTSLACDDILTAIHVPNPPSRFGAAFARFAQRRANACAVAGVAASVQLADDGTISDACIALSAVAPTPKLVPGITELLAGHPADNDALMQAAAAAGEAAVPISDVRGSAGFRAQIVTVLARRALDAASRRAKESAR
jgi:carbon-monoxide dehydrogenase medium subunit